MAPRLSRWIAMTAVAAVLVAVMFLSTGGVPLLFSGYGRPWWEVDRTPDLTPLERRMEGVGRSLARVRARRQALEMQALLAAELRRNTADPIAFTSTGDHLVPDRELTARLGPIWAELPSRRPEVRTVVIADSEWPGRYNISTQLDSTGLCIVRRPGRRDLAAVVDRVRTGSGDCLFAEAFGMPGAGSLAWLQGISQTGIPWNTAWRGAGLRWLRIPEEAAVPAWFSQYNSDMWDGWRHRPLGRTEMACLVGRPGACEAATGVGAAGWPGLGPRFGYIYRFLPSGRIPRDLLTSLGPEQFGRIWTSPDPIATSYARVTGRPMEEWLRQWALRFVPEPRRDNGLSLLGWIGAIVWLALLGRLTMERLKQRAVT